MKRTIFLLGLALSLLPTLGFAQDAVSEPKGMPSELALENPAGQDGSSSKSGVSKLVDEALALKKIGMSDSAIIDYLYQSGLIEAGGRPEAKGVFGNARLTENDIVKLKQAGFRDDFIAKFEGYPQYVTIGVAAIMLTYTNDIVVAPILRLFLVPRSYFQAQRPYWKKLGSHFPLRYPIGYSNTIDGI